MCSASSYLNYVVVILLSLINASCSTSEHSSARVVTDRAYEQLALIRFVSLLKTNAVVAYSEELILWISHVLALRGSMPSVNAALQVCGLGGSVKFAIYPNLSTKNIRLVTLRQFLFSAFCITPLPQIQRTRYLEP